MITSRILASAFGTYRVESSGPTVTWKGIICIRGNSLFYGRLRWVANVRDRHVGGARWHTRGGFRHSLPVSLNRLEFARASVSLLNNPTPTGAVPWVSPYPRCLTNPTPTSGHRKLRLDTHFLPEIPRCYCVPSRRAVDFLIFIFLFFK